MKRHLISFLIVAAWGAGAGYIEQREAQYVDGCTTDSECEEQCRAEIRPDEDPSICDVEA